MTTPLSVLGITKEEKTLLAERLFPEANKIFLDRLSKQSGYDPKQIEQLDYINHPVFIQQKWLEKRQIKAQYLKDNNIDTSEFDYPYKNIEEAKETDGDNVHIQLDEPESLKDIEKKFPKYWNAKEVDRIKKKIVKFKTDYDLGSISEEDEKSPHIV